MWKAGSPCRRPRPGDPASPGSPIPLETPGLTDGACSTENKKRLQRRADGEADRSGQRSEGSNPCPPGPPAPQDQARALHSGPPALAVRAAPQTTSRPSLGQPPPVPPSPRPLSSLPFLQRSQICHSDALTKPGNEWRTRETQARRGPQQPGNFPGSASEPLHSTHPPHCPPSPAPRPP